MHFFNLKIFYQKFFFASINIFRQLKNLNFKKIKNELKKNLNQFILKHQYNNKRRC